MKHILTVACIFLKSVLQAVSLRSALTALLLAPLAALHAAPSANAHIVIASEAGAKLDSDVNKGGGTDDTALIQSILDRAPKLGSLKLIVDGAILVKGLKIHSNTTIECIGSGSGFFPADHSDQPIIRNADPSATERKNRNLTFLGGTYNGNSANQTFSGQFAKLPPGRNLTRRGNAAFPSIRT
jgi:hypothetical protein